LGTKRGEVYVHTTLQPIYVPYQNLKANGYETDKNSAP
jgi:hypothetical protein